MCVSSKNCKERNCIYCKIVAKRVFSLKIQLNNIRSNNKATTYGINGEDLSSEAG